MEHANLIFTMQIAICIGMGYINLLNCCRATCMPNYKPIKSLPSNYHVCQFD